MKITFPSALVSINRNISQHADDLSARFHNNAIIQFVLMVWSTTVLLSFGISIMEAFGVHFSNNNYGGRMWIILLSLLFAPIYATFGFHLMRHASYHWYTRVDNLLGKWLD